MLPLGRYLKGKFREALGRSADTPDVVKQEVFKELSELYRQDAAAAAAEGVPACFRDPRSLQLRKNKTKIESLEKRFKIYAEKRSLS